MNFGPNDIDYVEGFRVDWERDGPTRFHWTGLHSSVRLPLAIAASGHRLRLRWRRHFVEPARVTITVEGRTAAAFEAVAHLETPYLITEAMLPPLQGRGPFEMTIQSSSTHPRPLGVALDWMQVERAGPEARFALRFPTRLLIGIVVLAAFLLPRASGSSQMVAAIHAGLTCAALTLGVFWDIVAAERILREGSAVYVGVGLLALAIVRWPRVREALAIPNLTVGSFLVLAVLMALALRLVVLLHPQFYYPDVKVHSLFAWQLARQGLVRFLQDFTLNQYRYSLGLQMENGHWYAFPYPPAFYLLTWPLVRLCGFRPEVAVSVLGAAVNSLMVFLVFGMARRLQASPRVALAAAVAVIVLPIYLARLSLAYFPALMGHAVDAVVIFYLLAHISDLARPRVIVTLGSLIAAALLTYTQSLLNFGILLPLFLALHLMADRSAHARRGALGLVLAGVLGGVLSLALFYGRYVPIFVDMQRGVPMPEEQVLLDKLAQASPTDEKAPPDKDDPFAGPGVDPIRGLKKAGWRLYVFYSVFAPAIVAGVLFVYRQLPRPHAQFVLAWSLTYLCLNLASGGLPGPNLVRYNKDLEIVAPLVCLALATLAAWLWGRARWLGFLFAAGFLSFGAARAVRYLTEKFVFER